MTNINETANGVAVTGGPLTTAVTQEYAESLLLNEIDRRVTKIRPQATPIDQISRLAGSRPAGSMQVDYYSVDTRQSETTVDSIASGSVINGVQTWTLTPADAIFDESETIIVVRNSGDERMSGIMLYVMTRNDDTGQLTVLPAYNRANLTDIQEGDTLIRMGRAATELDMQTPQFEALPRKATNNCQIFKMQIEESTYQSMANKEVGWTFTDQEEVAVMDMRLGIERTFLFGNYGRLYDPRKRENVYFTRGIWQQAGGDFTFTSSTVTKEEMVDLMKQAFTGNSGSSARKVLVAGSDLIAALNKMEYDKVISAGETRTRWGIDFTEITSKFGTLLVKHAEVFDSCGLSGSGLIIDPQYLTKYTHVPFTAERLDLRGAGVRNVNAVVVTEASCLVLRHPGAHVRVKLGPSATNHAG